MDLSFVGTSGGELEQIHFLLGHPSVQTTEHYLGCKQNLGRPANDLLTRQRTDGRIKSIFNLQHCKSTRP
jgi:hypothetical protein